MTTMKLCKNVVIPLLQSFHSRPLRSPSPTLHWPFLLCLLTKKRKSHRGRERRERRESTRTIQSFWPRATAGCFSFLPCFCTAFYPAFLSPHSLFVSLHLTLSPCLIPSLYTYTAYLASMKVSVYFRKCNLPLPVARFASFFFVFFIVSVIFN